MLDTSCEINCKPFVLKAYVPWSTPLDSRAYFPLIDQQPKIVEYHSPTGSYNSIQAHWDPGYGIWFYAKPNCWYYLDSTTAYYYISSGSNSGYHKITITGSYLTSASKYLRFDQLLSGATNISDPNPEEDVLCKRVSFSIGYKDDQKISQLP